MTPTTLLLLAALALGLAACSAETAPGQRNPAVYSISNHSAGMGGASR